LPSGCRLVRLSKRLNDTRMSFEDVLKCGSNFEMSPPCAVTSSFFCVVCAAADRGAVDGSTAARPSAPGPLRTSRRVTSICGTSAGKRGMHGDGDTAFGRALSTPCRASVALARSLHAAALRREQHVEGREAAVTARDVALELELLLGR